MSPERSLLHKYFKIPEFCSGIQNDLKNWEKKKVFLQIVILKWVFIKYF